MLKLAASQLSVHAVGNLLQNHKESGIGVPFYRSVGNRSSAVPKSRESEFPPTKIVTAREESGLQTPPNVFYTFFVNFALFLMSFAFFSQKTAIFCNFKLTMGV